jgi:hypothetical protein
LQTRPAQQGTGRRQHAVDPLAARVITRNMHNRTAGLGRQSTRHRVVIGHVVEIAGNHGVKGHRLIVRRQR